MSFFFYASFPNSRIKPRSATTTAFTNQIQIFQLLQPYTKVVEADPNRTYFTLQNLSTNYDMWFCYANDITDDPSVVATFGNPQDLRFCTSNNTLFQKQDSGVTTNWVATVINGVGQKLLKNDQITQQLDSPQDIYAALDLAVEPPGAEMMGVDVGVG